MRFVQIPTTLLAQVDSSVGGKTAINSPAGKNLIGAFHQPSLVLADTERARHAERARISRRLRRGRQIWPDRRSPNSSTGSKGDGAKCSPAAPARLDADRDGCAAKARVVAADETEQGERALLNLGHTFGHAFERLAHYDGARLVHGEGVAIGMACAFRFSRELGLCSGQDVARVESHLAAVGLPTRIADIPGFAADPEAILAAMRQDKKVERGRLTFILARGIGESFIAKDVPEAQVLAFLEREIAQG